MTSSATHATAVPTPVPTDPTALVAYLRAVPPADWYLAAEALTSQMGEGPENDDRAYRLVVDAAAAIDGTHRLIPEGFVDLYELMGKLSPDRQTRVADRLGMQLGGDPRDIELAANLVDQVLQEIAGDIAAKKAAAAFTNDLQEAGRALQAAQRRLDLLMGGDDYHVEYAETPRGLDLRAFLDDAARMLRAAVALNPCPNGAEQ